MNGKLDDVRLPFSVLDPIVGDVFSVLWEPEMIQETGSAMRILTGEILTQLGQTVLQHTVMTALMGALQWPISEFSSSVLFPDHSFRLSSPNETRLPHRQSLEQCPRSRAYSGKRACAIVAAAKSRG